MNVFYDSYSVILTVILWYCSKDTFDTHYVNLSHTSGRCIRLQPKLIIWWLGSMCLSRHSELPNLTTTKKTIVMKVAFNTKNQSNNHFILKHCASYLNVTFKLFCFCLIVYLYILKPLLFEDFLCRLNSSTILLWTVLLQDNIDHAVNKGFEYHRYFYQISIFPPCVVFTYRRHLSCKLNKQQPNTGTTTVISLFYVSHYRHALE